MKEKTVTLNQCQDCGCPGSKLEIVDVTGLLLARGRGKSPRLAIRCPYCKRTSKPIFLLDPNPNYDFLALVDNWNSINREYKEGLA